MTLAGDLPPSGADSLTTRRCDDAHRFVPSPALTWINASAAERGRIAGGAVTGLGARMATTIGDRSPPRIRTITTEAPWRWLSAGWRDMRRRPDIGLLYGVGVVVAGYALAFCLFYLDILFLLLPLAASFAIAGPMLAVGLYETSRRLAGDIPIRASDVILVAVRSPRQLAFIGVLLMIFALAWIRIATLLFALFFGPAAPPLADLIEGLFFSVDGIIFLAIGTAVGACLAFLAFSLSAVSIPLLMVRDLDAITAMIASVNAVLKNFWPMALWAWLIAIFTVIGVVTLLLGLIVTFPLIGHATWHAYTEVIEQP